MLKMMIIYMIIPISNRGRDALSKDSDRARFIVVQAFAPVNGSRDFVRKIFRPMTVRSLFMKNQSNIDSHIRLVTGGIGSGATVYHFELFVDPGQVVPGPGHSIKIFKIKP